MTRFEKCWGIYTGKRLNFSPKNIPKILKPSHSPYLSAYEDGTECSETSAYKIQTSGNYPEESIEQRFLCLVEQNKYMHQVATETSLNLVQIFFSFFSASSYFIFVIFIGLSGAVIGSSLTSRRWYFLHPLPFLGRLSFFILPCKIATNRNSMSCRTVLKYF